MRRLRDMRCATPLYATTGTWSPALLDTRPEQMRNLVARASTEFKYVIIDSPPIASFTDGVLISAIVDGVLLVVQGGKTSRQVVKRTRQMLQEIGAKVIGVVLNKVDLRSQDYYYYHQDYKNYYYGESNGNESGASKALAASGKH